MKTLKWLLLASVLLTFSTSLVSCASNEVQEVQDPNEGENGKYKD